MMDKIATELERNNKIAMIAHALDAGIMLLFILLQAASGMVSGIYLAGMLALGAIPVIAEFIFWKRNHETAAIKHLVACGFALFYTAVIFTTSNSLVFMFVIPMLLVVTLYNDIKYMLMVNIGVVIENILLVMLGSTRGGFGYISQDFAIVQVVAMLLICIYTVATTKTTDHNNRQKVSVIENAQKETDILMNNISEMSQKLKRGIEEINQGLEQFKETSELTKGSMKELTKGAADTSEAVEKQIVQTKEISDKVDLTSVAADSIMDKMNKTLEILEVGNSAVEILVDTTNNSVNNGREVNDKLKTLDTYMNEMNSIVSMIGSVANQTTLLALNAGIEAARAGEAGRGFSVVATEISKMADQTKEATVHIRELIENVTGSIKDVVEVISNMLDGIADEHESTVNAAESFKSIQQNTIDTSNNMKQLADNIVVLQTANQEIASIVETISYNAEEVAAHAEETMKSEQINSDVLTRLDSRMQQLMQLIKE